MRNCLTGWRNAPADISKGRFESLRVFMSIKQSPTLIFTWGNPSRGDDALGPEIHDQLLDASLENVEILTDFQLQIEHAVDLEQRQRILFIDASVSAPEPFEFYRLQAVQDDSYSTHAVSPRSLLAVYEKVNQQPAPPCYMLSVRGYQFDLGLPLSDDAKTNLALALSFIKQLVSECNADWDRSLPS